MHALSIVTEQGVHKGRWNLPALAGILRPMAEGPQAVLPGRGGLRSGRGRGRGRGLCLTASHGCSALYLWTAKSGTRL